ncbi:MAG: hypothetical protein JNL83_24715 [Myxococcales bacterium]|nr:hypothetical protein [Myxococcales bacterium]
MASEPSFTEALLLVAGAGAFVMWVISDVLEEQLLGQRRRERRKAVKAREHAAKRRTVKQPPPALPAARVHRGS